MFNNVIQGTDSKHFLILCVYDIMISNRILYFCMQMSKTQNKNHHSALKVPPLEVIRLIKQNLIKNMVKQYSTSQGYFFAKIIQDAIEKKQGNVNSIKTNDIKFDDQKEYVQKYYNKKESSQEFPQLIQYYKYYSQDSVCFLNRQFAFLSAHHDKKKAIVYQQLKKELNISDSQNTIEEVTGVKSHQKFDNVLTGLSFIYNNDQSYLVGQVLKRLVNHYGPSRVKTINKIDSQFKFMPHNIAFGKSKNSSKDPPNLNPQTMLESTNTSVRNNCYLKQKNKSNSKNTTHRRFGSCQVTKSPLLRSMNSVTPKENKKNCKIRRRKSAELISFGQLNTGNSNQMMYQSNLMIKAEDRNKQNKTINETNFRNKMEQLRNKIRKQKENLSKKGNHKKRLKK